MCSARSTARRGRSATSRRSSTCYLPGRLPLDRLVSHRLPLEAGRSGVRADELGRGAARRPRSAYRNRWRSSMNLDELDGRIGEGWGGPVAERLPRQRRPRPAWQRDGCRRDLDVHASVARSLAGALLRRRLAARVPADLAADADDEQGDRDDTRAGDDDLGRRPARHRPGGARLRRRRSDRGVGRPDRARRDLARRAGRRRDRRASRGAHRGRQGDQDVRRGARPARPPPSSCSTATRSGTRSTAAQ